MRKLETLLVVIALLVTLALFTQSRQVNREAAQEEFNRLSENSLLAVQTRMNTYLQSLNGAAAFLKTAGKVSRPEFDAYVSTLKISEYLPGISGIGFIKPIQAGEEAAFLQELEALGETELVIKPETEGPERFIIKRISPIGPNRQALGLDITFEEGRRNAAIKARETGEPQLTPRILLVQDATKQPGFLLLRPLYSDPADPMSEPVRPDAFLGWVYAPFVGRDLLTNLSTAQGRAYEFAVYDESAVDPDKVIYDSAPDAPTNREYQAIYTFEQFGREWTIRYLSTPQFENLFKTWVPEGILATGFLLTFLLLFAVRNQRRRTDALAEVADLRSRQVSAREEENRSLVENAVIGVLVLDEDRQIRFANNATQDLFGYSAAELKAMSFDRLVTELLPEEEDRDYNATGARKDGETLMLDLHTSAWLTHEGEARITAIVRDVTAEHEAVQELKRTKSIYDLALKGSQIGVFDLDLVDGTSEVSDTWLEIMGYDPQNPVEDTQMAFLSRVHPDDAPILQEADQACIEGLTSRSISEFRLLFPGDEWRWMRSDAVVVERDTRTRQALRMVGTQSDVTDLRHSRNALEASEMRFRQVVSAAPIGTALLSSEGQFIDVNDAFSELCGYDRQALQTQIRLQDLMPPDDLKAVYREVMRMIDSGKPSVYRGEHRILSRNGAERWGLFNISWTYDRNKDENFFIAQINDITDRKELEQIKSEFVSTVSHELRTPLTSIKGALGLIHAAENSGLSKGSLRLIDIARSNTDRLTTIVNDILDLEKISSGEVSFEFEACDLALMIGEAVKEMSPFAVTHGNELRVDLPREPVLVHADHGRIKQVLANLMSNACKYSDDETEIVIKAERLDEVAIIYVQNHGPGIPDAFRPRLFEAFSQADSSDTRAKGGTGLGLNITKQIVTRHDGRIGFESIPGSLTVFWFTLPLSQDARLPKKVTAMQKGDARKQRLRVLHLEDDRDFAEVIRSGLQEVAEVTNVGSIAAARELLSQHEVDVIIIDWSLPDGDATVLIEEITDRFPQVRILGLSADSDLRRDSRLYANLVKSRTELETIAAYVSGHVARAS